MREFWSPLVVCLLLSAGAAAQEPDQATGPVRLASEDSIPSQTQELQGTTSLYFPDYVQGEGWSVQLVLGNVDATEPATVEVGKFRDLVEAVDNPYLQAMVAVIGETGIRKGEALSLTWNRVDLGRGLLWVELTKNDEAREIPLSQYATGYLSGLPRYLNTPYVFVNSRRGTRWVNPDKSLRRAAERAGLKVGFHDLRRFRCSHWLMQGVNVRTVQQLMGPSAISTTMRYAAYVSSHALASIREVMLSAT